MIDLPKANYIEWNVKSVIKLNERDTYAYRVVLIIQDGQSEDLFLQLLPLP